MKRLLQRNVPLAVGLLSCTLSSVVSAGTPFDPFRTDSALHRDTAGYNDPYGLDCAIPGGALTFPAAVNLALCRNPQTRGAWATAHSQAAALGGAESAWVPSLSVTGGESRYFGEHADLTGNIVDTPQDTRDVTATLAWTIYDFGNRSGRIKSARSLMDAAAATATSVAQQTVRAVALAYYGAVADDALLVAAKSTEEITGHSLDIARGLQQGGAGTRADVLQAETAHGQAVLARIQADATAKTARGTLAITLGLTADEGFRLEPEGIPSEIPAFTARMADLMAEAARQRPDLKAAQFQRDAAEANITVARATGRPSIAFGALHNFTSTTDVQNENYNQIGITIKWPLFTGFATSYSVRQAQAALQVQEANLEQVGLTVTQDVWSSYYNLDSANQQLAVTAALSKTADDNMEVALGRYQAGVGSIVDVLTAQSAAASSRQLRINAELGWKVARAALALALGRLTSAEPLSNAEPLP